MTQGKLYVVATPIGNLDDITVRAIDVLKKANLIACEDTRKSRILLQRWDISAPLMSLHRFSERRRIKTIEERLERGEHVALISDAGTPAISDPGSRLIKAAYEAGFVVTPIPGASSITAALSVSGMDCSSFTYLGFVPRKTDQRRIFFEDLLTETRTTIFFETARRISATLTVAAEILASRRMVMLRELTKLHEDIISGTADILLKALESKGALRGEMTVAVEGAPPREKEEDPDAAVKHLMSEGFSGKRLAEEAHRRFGIHKTAAYRRYLELKSSSTQ
jgi:16S rRNA (cytidine1402-2'-O)-methyltransferase